MPKQYCVGAVEKAIKILDYLATHPNSSFSEIFTALDLSKSTTYQTLSTLEMYHYVTRQEDRSYCLDIGLLPLLQGIPKRNDLIECARAPVTEFAEETGYSVHLCILTEYRYAMCVFKISGVNFSIRTIAVGRRLSLHSSAAGKALMAWLPETEREQYLDTIEYTAFTDNTITDPVDYREELRRTKERGYSIDNGEGFSGVLGLGVPVFARSGELLGAISMGTVGAELDEREYRRVAERMYQTAHQIAENMESLID